jgi:hypothetical protein
MQHHADSKFGAPWLKRITASLMFGSAMALVASTPVIAQDDNKNASRFMEEVVLKDSGNRIMLHLQRH